MPQKLNMRYRIGFLFAFVLTFSPAASQQNADSIEFELTKHPLPDSGRINLLLSFCNKTFSTPKSHKAADEAILLSQQLSLPGKLAKAYISKASAYLQEGNDSLYLSCIEKAVPLFEKEKDIIGIAITWRGKGRYYQSIYQYYKAIECFEKANAIFEPVQANNFLSYVNNDIGTCYYTLGNYNKAIQYYLLSKKYASKLSDFQTMAMTTGNIAMSNKELKLFSSAVNQYREATILYSAANDSAGIASALMGIGICYDLQTKSDSALFYYGKAYGINSRNGIKLGMAHNLINTGITLKDMNRYSESYRYMMQAIEKYKELNRIDKIRGTEINIAELFCSAPDSFFINNRIDLSTRYTKAQSLLNGILEYAVEAEETDVEAKAWQGLSAVYQKQKNYEKAYEALNKFIALRDSLGNEEKVETATRLNDKFEFEKKEAVTQSLHLAAIKQEKTVRDGVAAGAGILLLGSIISFVFYKRKRDAVFRQQQAEFKSEVVNTERKALRSQMNPHFIFNSLNSIGDYIAKNNTAEANRYLSKFSKLMRMILENSEQKDVSIAEDLKALELYMQLEALRMNSKFTYEIKVDEELDREAVMIPPLILQPFVENSIWHGIANKDGNGKILIQIKKESEQMINCIVQDDGVGRKQDAILKTGTIDSKKNSLGMKITQARIDILNKIKNSNASVKLTDLDKGLRVEVLLPLTTNF